MSTPEALVWSVVNKINPQNLMFGHEKLELDRWPSLLKDPAKLKSILRIVRMEVAMSAMLSANQVRISLLSYPRIPHERRQAFRMEKEGHVVLILGNMNR